VIPPGVCGYVSCRAAQRYQVTENTIRTQLKSVLAKTGVRRQVDLVSLVNRLAAEA